MKFPYELSEQRISLLSKEDQNIYRFEHSDFYSYTEKQKGINAYQNALLERQGYYLDQINDDHDYDDMSLTEKQEMAKGLSQYEASVYLEDAFDMIKRHIGESLSIEEYEQLKNYIVEQLNTTEIKPINELDYVGPGKDMHWWWDGLDLKWLGKLAAGILTGLVGTMISLIIAGKDAAAMDELQKAMNKLVEKTDDGIYKAKSKSSFFGRLMQRFRKSKEDKFYGERNNACFRTIQEDFLKQVACDGAVLAKNMGFLSSKWSDAVGEIESNSFKNGGFAYFMENIGKPVASLSSGIHKN